ncbi:lipopolysaccharide biosynthesis protein [Gordonia sp. WA4-43]|uniref:lipopolysaccharide biosynthesis protein n=1 Tax=Gordonia sp. WA4-43 TaxID=2878678 RepID=UPI001CF964A3|nr:hypothetical protein [Gordonia sp. WA4-43]UCZ91850.1 hypothetical protein LEL84_09510 [Gordonia sp. WA4-43]
MSSATDRLRPVAIAGPSPPTKNDLPLVNSPRRALLGNAVLRIAARLASSAMLGVFLLLLARHMTVADFGQYILAYTLGMAVGLIVGVGAPVQAMRVSAAGGEIAAARLYVFHTIVVVTVFVLVAVALAISSAPAMLFAGGVFALSDTLQNYAQAHLAGVQAHTSASSLVFAQRAIPLMGCTVSAAAGQSLNAATLIAMFALTATIAVVAPAVVARRAAVYQALRRFRGRPPTKSARYWALSVSGVLSQLQVATFALFASALAVGYFSMATRVTGPLTLLAAAMSTVLIPELSTRVANLPAFRSLYRRYYLITVAYCGTVMIAAWPLSWLILEVVGPKYEPAQMLLVGMIVAAGLSSISQSISARYIAVGWPKTATVAIVAGGATTLALLALIGWSGHTDAVWVVPILGQTVVLVFMLFGRKGGHRR